MQWKLFHTRILDKKRQKGHNKSTMKITTTQKNIVVITVMGKDSSQ